MKEETTAMQIFSSPTFGDIRALPVKGEPWFVAADVCEVLGHTNPTMAVAGLDEDERAKLRLGRQGETNIISEAGLYTLAIRSNKENAKPFRRWVTHEVLPSIRKTGGYGVKALTAEARLVSAQARQSAESRRRLALEHKCWRDLNAATGESRAVLADIMRRNGIYVPDSGLDGDMEAAYRAAVDALLNAGDIGERRTYKSADYLCITGTEFRERMERAGHDAESVLCWMNKGGLIRTADGKSSVVTKMNGKAVRCVWVKLPALAR